MKKLFIIVSVFLFPFLAFAQRQTQGHMSVELYGQLGPAVRTYAEGVPPYEERMKAPTFGGGAALSFYNYTGRFVVGLDYLNRPHGYSEPELYDKNDNLISPNICFFYKAHVVSAYAGYMHRVWATRSRDFSVSVGGYLDIGVAVCADVSKHYATGSSTPEKNTGFYMGLSPDVQIEYFPFSSASIFLSVRPRITILDLLPGYTNGVHPLGSLGIKYYL